MFLRSAHQAANIYTQNKHYPKQKHVFVVRFNRATNPQTPSGSIAGNTSNLTYAVKTADRPGIQPHAEELNQYNKKRQVYTGYKFQPFKLVFWDDGFGTALNLYDEYSQYHFGDFSKSSISWDDDIVGPTFLGTQKAGGSDTNFGFVPSSDTQFFFSSIDVLHIYGGTYDIYTLVHPRITSFVPDDLEYERGDVSTITAEFVYEGLLLTLRAGAASDLPEFNGQSSGATFTDVNFTPEGGWNVPAGVGPGIGSTPAGTGSDTLAQMANTMFNATTGAIPAGQTINLGSLLYGMTTGDVTDPTTQFLRYALNANGTNLPSPAAQAVGRGIYGASPELAGRVNATVGNALAGSGANGGIGPLLNQAGLVAALQGHYPTLSNDGLSIGNAGLGTLNAQRGANWAQYGDLSDQTQLLTNGTLSGFA